MRRYLNWLIEVGQATDAGAADHFSWGVSTICSVRNALVDRGKVTAAGICVGRHGKKVTIWQAL